MTEKPHLILLWWKWILITIQTTCFSWHFLNLPPHYHQGSSNRISWASGFWRVSHHSPTHCWIRPPERSDWISPRWHWGHLLTQGVSHSSTRCSRGRVRCPQGLKSVNSCLVRPVRDALIPIFFYSVLFQRYWCSCQRLRPVLHRRLGSCQQEVRITRVVHILFF